jgi:hypothetical protein
MSSIPDWLPTVAAWIGAMVSAALAFYQWRKNTTRDIQKELNAKRIDLYPKVQAFLSSCYVVGWKTSMQTDGRVNELVDLSNLLILWSSDRTLRCWSTLVDNGQRGMLGDIGQLAAAWVELDISMRHDLGYGSGIQATDIYPILFAPRVVDKIREQQ